VIGVIVAAVVSANRPQPTNPISVTPDRPAVAAKPSETTPAPVAQSRPADPPSTPVARTRKEPEGTPTGRTPMDDIDP